MCGKYDHPVRLESQKSAKKIQTKKRNSSKLRKARQNLIGNVESPLSLSDVDKDNSTIEKLLSRESEIIVPLPLPSWETSSSKPINDINNLSDNELTLENNPVMKECSNEIFMKDLGVSCLKKSLDMTPPENLDGRNSESRHFSVAPMMIDKRMNVSNSFKTPADTGNFPSLTICGHLLIFFAFSYPM